MFPLLFFALILTGIFFADRIIKKQFISQHFSSQWVKGLWNLQTLINLILPLFIFIGAFFLELQPDDYIPSRMIYLFGLMTLPKILFLLTYLLFALPLSRTKAARLGVLVSGAIGVSLFAVLLYGGTVGVNHVQTLKTELQFVNLPPAFDGMKIVQISDLHLGGMLHFEGEVARMVDSIQSHKPDLIVFTGDLVNSRASEIAPHVAELSRLYAPMGVYCVMGNHDYGLYNRWKNAQALEENGKLFQSQIQKMGWKMLRNESTYLFRDNDSICLVGVENYAGGPQLDHADLNQASENIRNSNQFGILLSHNPTIWPHEVEKFPSIGLTLSGHTHAMQFQIGPFSPSSWIYPHWAGLYKEKEQYLYVNKGIGYALFASRFGAYPEITHITLRNNTSRNER